MKPIIDSLELRKLAVYIYLIEEEEIAKDISDKLIRAANTIDELRDFSIWLTGCGYNFNQHKYFREKRDYLLKNK